MAIVYGVPGTLLVMERAPPGGAFVKTSTGRAGRSQPDSSFIGRHNSRLARTIGNRQDGELSPVVTVVRQPESLAFGGKNSGNCAVNNWRSGATTPSFPCQPGS